MKTINTFKKISIAILFTFVLSSSSIFAQNDTMYVMKNGAITAQYNINTEVDSIIFYRPAISNPGGGGSGTYPNGTVHCTSSPTAVVDVINPTTGKTWMDRNLGAIQAATYSSDADSYGDLYQWGRGADGHQCRNSATTSNLSTTNAPGHGNFILSTLGPNDWRNPQNNNLWQGVNGTNNPCPSGYRLPTFAELDAERNFWSSNDASGAFASPLKFTMAGYRYGNSGLFDSAGAIGCYWSSTINGTKSHYLYFDLSMAGMYDYSRADGHSVRCIKD